MCTCICTVSLMFNTGMFWIKKFWYSIGLMPKHICQKYWSCLILIWQFWKLSRPPQRASRFVSSEVRRGGRAGPHPARAPSPGLLSRTLSLLRCCPLFAWLSCRMAAPPNFPPSAREIDAAGLVLTGFQRQGRFVRSLSSSSTICRLGFL